MIILPERLAGNGVQGKKVIVGRGQVENAIGDDGRGFELAGNTSLEDPGSL